MRKKHKIKIVVVPAGVYSSDEAYHVVRNDVVIGWIWHNSRRMQYRTTANDFNYTTRYKTDTPYTRTVLANRVVAEHNQWQKERGLAMLKLLLA